MIKVKKGIILICLAIFILLVFLPYPLGLPVPARRSLGVFVLCLGLWITGLLPLAVTSLLGMGLIPLLKIMEPTDTFALFGNKAIFFILGALIMAAAVSKSGLGARVAYDLLMRFNRSPSSLIAGVMIIASGMSLIVPEHAVAALLFPIILEITVSLGLKPGQSNLGTALFLAMAWGAVIGGITTFLGGARNILAVGILKETYGLSIGFYEWIKYSWPISISLLIVTYLMIIFFFRPEVIDLSEVNEELKRDKKRIGSLKKDELKLIQILIVVILCWLFLPGYIDISVTALLGGVLVFIFNILEWSDLKEYLNWGVIIMYGGALVVTTTLTKTGVTIWIAERLTSNLTLSVVLFIIIISIVTKLLTEGVSNVAAVAIIIPLVFSTGGVFSINPAFVTLLVAISAGLAFCLPMGTPPNAIAYSSGYLKIWEVVKVGAVLNIVSIIVIYLVAYYYWPIVGLSILK